MGEHTRGATILIVEDVSEIRAAMRKVLEVDGYRVVEASNDWEALERARTERVDLVLTDFELPTLEGLRRAGRDEKALAGVPIVIVEPDAAESRSSDGITVVTHFDQLASLLGSRSTDLWSF